MSGSSDDTRTGERPSASLEEKTDQLREQLSVFIDQLGQLVRDGSADPKRSRSERIVDIERLSKVYERLRKSVAEELAEEAPETAQTLTDLMLEYDEEKNEEGDVSKDGSVPQ